MNEVIGVCIIISTYCFTECVIEIAECSSYKDGLAGIRIGVGLSEDKDLSIELVAADVITVTSVKSTCKYNLIISHGYDRKAVHYIVAVDVAVIK